MLNCVAACILLKSKMNEENHQHDVDLSFSKKQRVGKSMDSPPAVLQKSKNWFWPVLGGSLLLWRTSSSGS
jgi:hypothetical protein